MAKPVEARSIRANQPSESPAERQLYSSGRATRELLIETAERLFGERGIDAVSINEIGRAAGQRHASVIAYYFGTKEGLVRAILDHRLRTINAERAEMLAEIERDGRAGDARSLLWALIKPWLSSIDRDERYVSLLARLLFDKTTMNLFETTEFAEQSRAMVAQIRALAEPLPPRLAAERSLLLFDSMLQTLSRVSLEEDRLDEQRLSHFLDVWVAMLTTPLSNAHTSEPRNDSEHG